ncbi:MAG: phage tail sheath family protein [Planctomycetes bacterium]|nr:phage tail sheath family protein [Planctomycetota bacterium]
MPEYLSPGVYIEEIEIGAKPIEGVATSTAAFLGATERGPLQPRLVTSWIEYTRWFGGFRVPPDEAPDESLPMAVRAFFDNGGQRVYVTRIVKAPVDGASITALAEIGGIQYRASGSGSWGNRVFLRFAPAGSGDPNRFRLLVYYWDRDIEPANAYPAIAGDRAERAAQPQPVLIEDFDDLDLRPASTNFVEKRVEASALVRPHITGALAMPAVDPTVLLPLIGGTDGALPLVASDYDGQGAGAPPLDASWGLTALAEPPFEDVAIVYAPRGFEDEALRSKLVIHCENNKYRFLIVDAPANQSDPGTLNPRSALDSKYVGFYYPWYWTAHPVSSRIIKVAPGGAVAGIFARSDVERGVWKAPANETVRGALELEFDITKAQQDVLNPRGVNVIRAFPGRGIRLWGARTLSSDPLWKYVNVRRLFIFLEASIYRGTQWVVFEPNNEALWARVKQTVEQFLRTQWRAGALMGLKEEQAFFVKVDRTTMTQDDIDNGRLIVVIGVSPVKPAEFVIFRFAQFTAPASANA